MTIYPLYLESGPRRKKTMVHVFDLLGCSVVGPTTEAAVQAVPGAIHAFRRFLEVYGEPVDPVGAIETVIAEHITEGIWLGNGDPTIVFSPDLQPLSVEEMEIHIRRLEWMRADLADLLVGISEAEWLAEPGQGRSLQAIIEHVVESEYNYICAYGRIAALPAAGSILSKREGDLLDWFGWIRAAEIARLRELTDEQRSEPFEKSKHTYTARKVLRRMLEHQWEHLVEVRGRLGAHQAGGTYDKPG